MPSVGIVKSVDIPSAAIAEGGSTDAGEVG